MKVTLVIGSRANWGRSRTIALAAMQDDDVELDLVLMGSALDEEFGSTAQDVQSDGLSDYKEIPLPRVNNRHKEQALATAVALERLTEHFDKSQPDFVITIADRFETMATAIAATYSNIKLVHVQGGEISGNIDDRVRNAISMLADIHFPSTGSAATRLKSMVKKESQIYMLGCPAMDTLKNITIKNSVEYVSSLFSKTTKKTIAISIHPNTEDLIESVEVLDAIIDFVILNKDRFNFVIFKPNIDAGNGFLRERLMNLSKFTGVKLVSGLDPVSYAMVLSASSILIGNSSSFIRESSTIGKPAIIVGNRQRGRDVEDNVTFVNDLGRLEYFVSQKINKKYKQTTTYGAGDSGIKIMQKLKEVYNV